MNDRYLFKAKRINTKEWVQGFYAHTFNEDERCAVVGIMAENDWIIEANGNMTLIDKNTLCQSTGLKDKNGNLIWENDVVKYHFGDVYAPVKYGSYQSCFDSQKTEHIGFYVDWSADKNYRKDLGYWANMVECEVIGNIFDNPELLER